jgi:DNA-binding XRE family transcriptional regulator
MSHYRFSSTRCRSETFITLPGGVSFLVSIHNELTQSQRKSLLRRVFRQLKPIFREITEVYGAGGGALPLSFDRTLDPRDARRVGAFRNVRRPNTLEAIRARLGWSQKELAQRTGISACQISRIEQGHSKGSPQTWKKIRSAARAAEPQCGFDESHIRDGAS